LAVVFIVLISCILSIWLPSITAKLLFFIFVLVVIRLLNIGMLQILFLTALLGVIVPSEFDQLANFTFGLGVSLAIVWIVASVSLGFRRFDHHRQLDILVAIYIIFAINGIISTANNWTFGPYAIIEITKYVLYGSAMAITYHFISDLRDVRKLLTVLLITSVIIATYSYQIAFAVGIKTFLIQGITVMHSLTGAMSNPGLAAGVVTDSIPISLAYLMFGKDKRKYYLFLGLSIYFIVIWILWNSRSNYIFLFSAFLTLLLFHEKGKRYFFAIVSCAIAAFAIIESGLIPILSDLLRLEKGLTYRGDLWEAAMRMIVESPILGKGLGYYDKFKFMYMDPGPGRAFIGTWHNLSPHNVLIERAVEMGIGASLLQLIIWVFPVVVMVKNSRAMRHSKYFYMYAACGAIWVGIIFRSSFAIGGNLFGLFLLPIIFKMPMLVQREERTLTRVRES
jgi:O-antigen ligase